VYNGALNLIRVVRGPGSVQEAQLIQAMSDASKSGGSREWQLEAFVLPATPGALRSLVADLGAGLVGNIAMQGSGAVLGDLLGLAKEALGAGGESERNVAAVLVAAAFEDTLRRLAETKAGVTDRPKLEAVITELKRAGVLAGASVSTANGYLKFRNDALHADWQHLQPATISSCLAFVEALLVEHFS
jgi:hypothetical protein